MELTSTTSIFDLPVDSLAVVCELCDASDLTALLITGCLVLASKITIAAQKVHCEIRGCSRFPFSLFNLPRLRELSVSIVEPQFADYPLRLEGRLPLPASAIPTLQSLKLSFAQSFAILGPSAPDLRTLFPNLTDLSLLNSIVTWDADYLRRLPQTLRKLHLRWESDSFDSFAVGVSIDDLNSFPPFLEELTLSLIDIDTSQLGWDKLVWPVGLRKLILLAYRGTEDVLFHLPSLLEHLEIFYYESFHVARDHVLPLSLLPRTMKTFKLDSSYITLNLDCPLPPNLEVMHARANWQSLVEEMDQEQARETIRRYCPPSLREVELLQQLTSGIPYYFLVLPLYYVDLWSQSLKDLPYPLPSKLKVLKCKLDTMAHVLALPSDSLTSLTLYTPPSNLEPRGWFHLASFLHSLNISVAYPMDVNEVLRSLEECDGLTHASSPLTDLTINSSFATDVPRDLGLYIPANLTALKLTISAKTEFTCLHNIVSQLSSRLVHLKSIDIFNTNKGSRKDIALPPKSVLIPLLPRGITSLSLWFEHFDLDVEHMRQLPPNLTSLNLRSNRESLISDAHFAHLPKSITELRLSHEFTGFTSEIWAVLPPYIKNIGIKPYQPRFMEDGTKYYTDSGWPADLLPPVYF